VEVSAYNPAPTGQQPSRRKLGVMFGAIEEQKAFLNVQDYSIAQTSLEQIFNQFAAQVLQYQCTVILNSYLP
jgi:hypothetical protein